MPTLGNNPHFEKFMQSVVPATTSISSVAGRGQEVISILTQIPEPTGNFQKYFDTLKDTSVTLFIDDVSVIVGEIPQENFGDFINDVFKSPEINNERKAMLANVLYFQHGAKFPSKGYVRATMRAICEYYNKIAHFKTTSDDTDPKLVARRSGAIVENEFQMDGKYDEAKLRDRLSRTPYFFEKVHIDAIVTLLSERERVI